MQYVIREITIENIKKNTFVTHQIKDLVCADGSEVRLAICNPIDETVVTFYIYVYGNICEYTSSNEDIVIKSIPGLEIINKNNCKPENINDWTALLG